MLSFVIICLLLCIMSLVKLLSYWYIAYKRYNACADIRLYNTFTLWFLSKRYREEPKISKYDKEILDRFHKGVVKYFILFYVCIIISVMIMFSIARILSRS